MNYPDENTCDCCEQQYDVRYYCVTPRPSCPQELVSIMWVCEDCATNTFGGEPKTAEQLNDYFDSGEARKDGLLWLTI